MESVILMDMSFRQLGELALYESLVMKRSFYGVGACTLTLGAGDEGAELAQPGALMFLASQPQNVMILEDVTRSAQRVTATGVQLKGLAKRRICVPPLSLPAALWEYREGAWTEITDDAEVRAALEGEVYQGFQRPASPQEGMRWLDMSELGAVYDWGTTLGAGAVVSDLGTAQLRSKYQNFGWDRFVGSAEDAYLHYAQNNLIAPEDENRAIPGLTAGESLHRGAELPWQARFDRLSDLFERIGEATGLGWDIVPDFAARRFAFVVTQGRDLGGGLQSVLVSEEMGNAAGITRKHKTSGSSTTVYAGGAGEDENRLILSVGNEAAGVERRELWAEAGSVEDVEMLRLFGQGKMAATTDTLEADMLDSGACRYGEDYALGDVVLVAGAGAWMSARIVEVTETYEAGSRSVSCAFGDAPVTAGGVLARIHRAGVR